MSFDSEQKGDKINNKEFGWWFVKFKINWPEVEQPHFHVDIFITHRIVFPILRKYRAEIRLWRFHRRAKRDDTGHEFKFIFYSTPSTANDIYSEFRSSSIIKSMRRNKIIKKVEYDNTVKTNMPGIGDTCDPNWSDYVKESWPYYIMGVSDMLLIIINKIYTDNNIDDKRKSMNKLIEEYKTIQNKLTDIWQREGRHAFLHHLNALFGYEPMQIEFPTLVQTSIRF